MTRSQISPRARARVLAESARVSVLESELEVWAAITERHLAIEKAAAALVKWPTNRATLERLRAALKVRP
jgi:hypothetical protein